LKLYQANKIYEIKIYGKGFIGVEFHASNQYENTNNIFFLAHNSIKIREK